LAVAMQGPGASRDALCAASVLRSKTLAQAEFISAEH